MLLQIAYICWQILHITALSASAYGGMLSSPAFVIYRIFSTIIAQFAIVFSIIKNQPIKAG